MIEKMHERTNSLAFKIIFALIAVSFVLGGIGTVGLMNNSTAAAKVNGEEISAQMFSSAKSRQESLNAQRFGEAFWEELKNPAFAERFYQGILNNLINDELQRQYIDNLKLAVSTEQVKSYIVNLPEFQENGKFSNSLYQQTLKNAGISPDGYASIIAQEMVRNQLQQGIIDTEFSVPAQQEKLAKLFFQKRYVQTAIYSIQEEIANQTASEEELKNYFEANQKSFFHPEKMVVEYVTISPDMLKDRIEVTKEQIETYYNTNKAQLTAQGEVRVAHIQVADEIEAKAIAAELANGADFAALAKQKSQDSLSAENGGELGWVKSGIYPAEFESALEDLEVGKNSQPVKIDNAYHVIKVLERVSLDTLSTQIERIIRNELLLAEFSKITNEMANLAFENSGSLQTVAQVANVSVNKTGSVSRDTLPELLNNEKITRVLFSKEMRENGKNSEAIEIGDELNPHRVFVRIAEIQPEQPKSFEEAKAELETQVKYQKAQTALKEKSEEALKNLASGNLQAVKFGEEIATSVAEPVFEPAIEEKILSAPKPTEKPLYYSAQVSNGDVVIIALNKVEDGSFEALPQFAAQFNHFNRLSLESTFVQNLRERASVEIDEKVLTPSTE